MKCLLNNEQVEQSLYRAYIRSAKYEKAGARDSTYIKYEVECNNDSCATLFSRVHFFLSLQLARKRQETYLIAYIEEVPVVQSSPFYKIKKS